MDLFILVSFPDPTNPVWIDSSHIFMMAGMCNYGISRVNKQTSWLHSKFSAVCVDRFGCIWSPALFQCSP